MDVNKMPVFSEKTAIEDYIVEKLQDKGWRYVPADELERESYDEPLLVNNLIRKIRELNAKAGLGDEEIKNVLNELKLKGTGIEGHKAILNFYKYGVPVRFEKERVVKYVRLFDYDEVDKNEFIVTRQAIYHGKEDIRTDIMLYVNGIPLVDIECKNPASFTETWYNAYEQIKDYEDYVPELYKYVQIGIGAEQVAKYFPIVPWQKEDIKIHQWREKGLDSIDSTIEMLSLPKLLDILRYYLFFRMEGGNATKVIARYMQYRASEKMVNRVLRNLRGEEEKKNGLIWHWQGSGKTLTMIFAANKLYLHRRLENPSIFFIVDRIELEDQLYQEFYSLDIVEPEIIDSIRKLRSVLKHDEGRGKRGIMITLIHKFRSEELQSLQKELESLSKEGQTIMNRQNVIAFIDEGHRTQYGTMAAQMKAILRGAFFFALTGTPISKRGRDTYLEFSYPEAGEDYLDRYFIKESIEDGFTTRIVYQPRLEKEMHLDSKTLKTLFDIMDAENLDELPDEAVEKVKKKVGERLNAVRLILENPRWIKKKAEDIALHFKEHVDGKFKAMVVAASREACARYKRELDRHLPPEYSEVVISYTPRRDRKAIESYVREARARYGGLEYGEVRKEVIDRFKEEEMPKILIVTDMLLTGFDAPVLQTMYLDKPLREHRLLQAIARTNRPYKDVKEAGLIIDYIGILREFKRAFEMYHERDIQGVLYNRDEIREEFKARLKDLLELFADIPKDRYDRKTLIKAVEVLTTEEEKGKRFQEDYRAMRKLFQLLGPDLIKAEVFSTYKWLSAIYVYYTKTVIRSQPSYERYVSKYFDKTVTYVHHTTELERLEKDLPAISFDQNYLKKIEQELESKEEKAANIVFTLNRLVLVERHKNPVYIPLLKKVENILELWKEKTKDFERIYKEGIETLEELQNLTKRQKDLGFSDLEYSLLLTLEDKFGRDKQLESDVSELSALLKEHLFPGWMAQTTARKRVEREIRRFVRRRLRKRYGVGLEELNDLTQKLIESVKNYGTSS